MRGWLVLLFQIGDFFWKAGVRFAATPEGEKELSDIADAWENRAMQEDNPGNVQFNVESYPSQAARDAQLKQDAAPAGKTYVNTNAGS